MRKFYIDKFVSVQRLLATTAGAPVFDTSLKRVAPRHWAVLKPLKDAGEEEAVKLRPRTFVSVVELTLADLKDNKILRNNMNHNNITSVQKHFCQSTKRLVILIILIVLILISYIFKFF